MMRLPDCFSRGEPHFHPIKSEKEGRGTATYIKKLLLRDSAYYQPAKVNLGIMRVTVCIRNKNID